MSCEIYMVTLQPHLLLEWMN